MKGTPVKQIAESLVKALVQHGDKREVVESELYWAMQERRMETRRFEGASNDEEA